MRIISRIFLKAALHLQGRGGGGGNCTELRLTNGSDEETGDDESEDEKAPGDAGAQWYDLDQCGLPVDSIFYV